MGIHLADQTLSFLYALLLGAVLGVLFDAFRILRIAFPSPRGVLFAQDLLYWMICAAASFLFLLTCSDGVVRVFLLIGELIGGILYHCTLGVLVMGLAQAIIRAIRAFLHFLGRYLLRPIWKLAYGLISLLLLPVRWIWEILKNLFRKVKFRLKVRRILVYNHFVGMAHKKHREIPSGESAVHGTPQKKETGRKKKRHSAPVHLHFHRLRRGDAGGYAGDIGEPKTGSGGAGTEG